MRREGRWPARGRRAAQIAAMSRYCSRSPCDYVPFAGVTTTLLQAAGIWRKWNQIPKSCEDWRTPGSLSQGARTQYRVLRPVRAFERFEHGEDHRDCRSAESKFSEVRIGGHNRAFHGVLRDRRGAAAVLVILVIVGIFRRDGFASVGDGVFGNDAIGMVVVHGFLF